MRRRDGVTWGILLSFAAGIPQHLHDGALSVFDLARFEDSSDDEAV
jgi:hypothetical protein